MVGFQGGNDTVLTAILTRPPNFTYIPDPFVPGTYLLGHTRMVASNFPIMSFWKRTLTKADDFILGFLSMLLAAVFADIIATIVLRLNRFLPLTDTLRAAHTINPLFHPRNIRAALSQPRCRRSYLIALVFAVAFLLREPILVIITQQDMHDSAKYQYNVIATQPVSTTQGRAKLIRRIAGARDCVTPAIIDAKQIRNFAISACIRTDFHQPSTSHWRQVSNVTVTSWYHQGGNDHHIAFGDGWYDVSTRAYLYVEGNDEGGKHILFHTNKDVEHAFYVQELLMHASMERICNRGVSRKDPPPITCTKLMESYRLISRRTIPKTVLLWRGKSKNVTETVDGVASQFEVLLPLPYVAINSGVRVLFTNSALREVDESGAYTRIKDDGKEDGIPGLISEVGRVAGIWLMCALLVSLSVLMVILRVKLRPPSLREVGIGGPGRDVVIPVDEWEVQEQEMIRRGLGARRWEADQNNLQAGDGLNVQRVLR